MEVERKWLVGEPPAEAIAAEAQTIAQGYLAIEGGGAEVRLRRRDDRRFLTAKSGRGLSRTELEVELTAEQFEALWPGTAGRRIEKTRRVLDLGGGLAIELDEFSGSLSGLRVAEVEFPDEGSARAFTPPYWFGREVTDEGSYNNQQLALHGLPQGPAIV